MLSISELRSRVDAGHSHVVVRYDGVSVDVDVPHDFGEVVLLVSPMTDALKVVSRDMLVEGSVDRDSVMGVEGVVLDAETVARLGFEEADMRSLIDAVIEMGREMDARQATALLGPSLRQS